MTSAPRKLQGFKTGTLYVAADFLIKAMQFALLPLASAALPLQDYAALTLYMTILTAATPLLTMSVEAAYSVYFTPQDGPQENRVFAATLLLALGSSLFWLAVGLLVLWFAPSAGQGGVLTPQSWLLIATYIFLDLVVRVENLGQRLGFFHVPFALYSIAYQIAKFAVAVPLIFWMRDAQWYLVATTAVAAAFALVMWRRNPRPLETNRETVAMIARYTAKASPASLAAIANNTVDRIMITVLLSTLELARYHSMFAFAGLIQVFILALNKLHVAQMLADFRASRYSFIQQRPEKLRLAATLWFCVTALTILVGRPAFNLLFSDNVQFDFAIYSALCWYFSVFGFYFVWGNILSMEESTAHLKALGYGLTVLPNVVLSYMLTKMFDGLGAAHATLAANLISALILLLLVRKVTGKLYFFREFLAFYLLATLFQGAALTWLA